MIDETALRAALDREWAWCGLPHAPEWVSLLGEGESYAAWHVATRTVWCRTCSHPPEAEPVRADSTLVATASETSGVPPTVAKATRTPSTWLKAIFAHGNPPNGTTARRLSPATQTRPADR